MQSGLEFEVVESVPVHEDIKLGLEANVTIATGEAKNVLSLPIGAVSPAEIALSILAEVVASLRKGDGA